VNYVDLFAGCGGLSLGLSRAGFEHRLAVEKSDMAGETYFHNFIARIDSDNWSSHLAAPMREQAGRGLVVGEVASLLADDGLCRKLRDEQVDLIAGGPPCQGFSLAGRRDPKDPRNELPWQFLHMVDALVPRAVILENVAGMAQRFNKRNHDSPFEQLAKQLAATDGGYVVQQVLLNAMHYGVPQHRPRVMLIALRADIAKRLGIKSSGTLWRSSFLDELESVPDLAPRPTTTRAGVLTVDDALWDLGSHGYNTADGIGRYAAPHGAYALSMRRAHLEVIGEAAPKQVENHNLRKHAPHIAQRFALYQFFAAHGINSNILNMPNVLEGRALRQEVERAVAGITSPFRAPSGVVAKDLAALVHLVCELKTKKHSQRALQGDQPSPTVVSLPDDFVHYLAPRTLTVREMARFQSFPDAFVFRSKETTGGLRRRIDVPQYTQVGNAVPPKLANAVGGRLSVLLGL